MLALIENNTVIGTFTEGGWFSLPDGRSSSPAVAGWTLDDYSLVQIAEAVPIPSGKRSNGISVQMVDGVPTYVYDLVDLSVAELKEYASNRKRTAETGGVTFAGLVIATDRESQAMISGAYLTVQRDPARVIQWKTSNGFVPIDALTMAAIADAVSNHVQDCFAKEAEVCALIDSGEIKTFEQIEAADWPSQSVD